ncbi:transposase, partial [Dysgonomonas sp. PH5-45]|nr:transposase [Dysgonomonas sp. PH5-45]MDH6388679.1 transposase [Dysgonomonas sp. PH5-37]
MYRKYSRLGSQAYHPRLMLKLLVYAYLRNVYSSRRIEDLCRNDIRFLWLNGMDVPDHNTINRFRSGRLKGVLKEVFSTIVKFLVTEGLVSLDRVYTDGTKIESSANRYTFVWGKSISTRISKIAEQLNEHWAYAESVTKQELMEETPLLAEDISADKVAQVVDRIDEALRDVDCDKKVKQKVKRVKKACPEQLKRYEQQEQILDGRGSYSKTDPDATFMRMKEDHMLNGQLKPAFNVQISTNEQFISNYTLHQTTADTTTYTEHIEEFKSLYGFYPQESIADAGYGSEENYLYARSKNINPFIKYNYFHKEQTKKWRTDPFRSSNFYYNG